MAAVHAIDLADDSDAAAAAFYLEFYELAVREGVAFRCLLIAIHDFQPDAARFSERICEGAEVLFRRRVQSL